jgi:ligand-binding SRPBCC domain-containing protein
MAIIITETEIRAPIEVCFDLARSIDVHVHSTRHTNEIAVDGVTTGLLNLGESVTWEAHHFWRQRLASKITQFDRPRHFRDSMVAGVFKRFDHDHHFETRNGITVMIDTFDFDSPFGLLGRAVDALFLKAYMKKLLERRNQDVKTIAEDQELRLRFLPQDFPQ